MRAPAVRSRQLSGTGRQKRAWSETEDERLLAAHASASQSSTRSLLWRAIAAELSDAMRDADACRSRYERIQHSRRRYIFDRTQSVAIVQDLFPALRAALAPTLELVAPLDAALHCSALKAQWLHRKKKPKKRARGATNGACRVERMLSDAPSAGIVHRASGVLVAGCAVHASGGLGLLFTAPARRRKGLARLVVAALVARLCDDGVTPFADIARGNSASCKLFESLSFRDGGLATSTPRPRCTAVVETTSSTDQVVRTSLSL